MIFKTIVDERNRTMKKILLVNKYMGKCSALMPVANKNFKYQVFFLYQINKNVKKLKIHQD